MRQHVCSFIMRWTIYILQIYFYLEILILHSFSVLQFLRIYFLGSILNYPVLIISLTHPTCSYTKSPIPYTTVSLTHRDHISLKNFYLNNKYLKKNVNYNIWCTFSVLIVLNSWVGHQSWDSKNIQLIFLIMTACPCPSLSRSSPRHHPANSVPM